jgi:homospermidine synthase
MRALLVSTLLCHLALFPHTHDAEAFNAEWTPVDGGEGYLKDHVTVDDGFKPWEMKAYDGDARTGPLR